MLSWNVGSLTGDSDFPPAPYRGLSGAPIYRSGQICGINCALLWQSRGRVFGWMSIDKMRRLWDAGTALGAPLAGTSIQLRTPAVPGTSICAMEFWGDVNFGYTGHIGEVIGNKMIMFGHSVDPLRAGPRLYAVFHAPVLALASSNGEFGKICARGSMIGTASYAGELGLFGHVGAAPPTVECTVIAPVREEVESKALRCTIVRDSEAVARGLAHCIEAALRWADVSG